MNYRVNAGKIDKSHWSQHPEQGGGRVLGEVCHFVDLMQAICGSNPVEVYATAAGSDDEAVPDQDNVIASLRFENGSIGTITYAAGGAKSIPKEELSVMGGGLGALLDNFRSVDLYRGSKRNKKRCPGKGHAEEVAAFVRGIQAGRSPISFESLVATSATTLAILTSLARREPVAVEKLAGLSE